MSDKPEIKRTVGPTGALIESWPHGASVIEMRGIPFRDSVPNQAGEIRRTRVTAPEKADVVTFKHEDETEDGMPVGPVWIDDAPAAEVNHGGTWTDDWYTKKQAKEMARRLGAKFGDA